MNGLIIDNFAGGGGASTGIEAAIGRPIDVAINHDAEAIAMHQANHPNTVHYCEDVFSIDPLEVVQRASIRRAGHDRLPVWLAWFSPDCTHFSKAKGAQPRRQEIRGLAGVVHDWIDALRPTDQHPRIIMLENVDEFRTWGPLLDTGMPCPDRRGETFSAWVQGLRDRGYQVQYRKLRACDFTGEHFQAATSRERLFLIARCDGQPIIWPSPTHGRPGSGLPKWRTTADIIDFGELGQSIFNRARPLAENTCRRIAHGFVKHVLNAPAPFIVPVTNSKWSADRAWSSDEPLRTITTAKGGDMAMVMPILDRQFGKARGASIDAPLGTIMTKGGGKSALVSATLIQTGYGERAGQTPRVPGLDKPLGTIVQGGKHALISAFMAQHNTMPRGGIHPGKAASEPLSTITGRGTQTQLVAATLFDEPAAAVPDNSRAILPFLIKYYGAAQHGQRVDSPLDTITAKARFGLVSIETEHGLRTISDIRMRMLFPRELYRAQGFPETYNIAPMVNGKPMTKTSSIAKCGNSVPPNMSEVLTAAQIGNREAKAMAA